MGVVQNADYSCCKIQLLYAKDDIQLKTGFNMSTLQGNTVGDADKKSDIGG